MPLPGCLFDLLNSCVIPNARRDGDAQHFAEVVLPSQDVQLALKEARQELGNWYELVSQGYDYLSLNQWIGALDRKQQLTDLCIKNYVVRPLAPHARPRPDPPSPVAPAHARHSPCARAQVRTSEPQARAAFYASAKKPLQVRITSIVLPPLPPPLPPILPRAPLR